MNKDAVTKYIYCSEFLGEMSDVAHGHIVIPKNVCISNAKENKRPTSLNGHPRSETLHRLLVRRDLICISTAPPPPPPPPHQKKKKKKKNKTKKHHKKRKIKI